MESYFEINFSNTPSVMREMVQEQFYAAFHGTLRRHGHVNIGLSFPDLVAGTDGVEASLGDRVLVCSSDEGALKALWRDLDLDDLAVVDLIGISGLRTVPADAPRACFRRNRAVEKALREKRSPKISLPAVKVQSASRKKAESFNLYIERIDVSTQADAIAFNTYGLSSERSVPVI